MNIRDFLRMQEVLQSEMRKANPTLGGSPFWMDQDAIVEFIRWNTLALTDELHEMLGEVGWKPWASSQHVNHPEAMHEMVDAWHFFLNILLAIAAANGLSITEMGTAFEDYYKDKNAKNLQRQVDGYDGVSTKCPNCKRELSEVPPNHHMVDTQGTVFCCLGCLNSTQEKNMPKKKSAKSAAEKALQDLPEVQQVIQFPPAEDLPTIYQGKAGKILQGCAETGEPIFIFRAKDLFSIQVLMHYMDIVERFGPSSYELQEEVAEQVKAFKDWQRDNVDKVRYPD